MNVSLCLDSCEYTYDKQFPNVLTKISFDAQFGDLITIYGANGSGKSTLLKLVRGLLTPQAGTISFRSDGRPSIDCMHESPSYLVFSDPDNAFLGYTPRDDIEFMLSHTTHINQRINEEIFQKLDIEELLDRPVLNLSHGQRKLMSLAIALSSNLPILLFDEPFAFLQSEARQRLITVLTEIKKNRIILLTAQEPSIETFFCSNRLMVLDHELVFDGNASQLLSAPSLIEQTYLSKDTTFQLLCQIQKRYPSFDFENESVLDLFRRLLNTHAGN